MLYLTAAYNSVKPFVKDNNIQWYIVNDLPNFYREEFLSEFPWANESWIHLLSLENHGWGFPQRNLALDFIQDGWCMFLDDDNIMHPEFYPEFSHFMDADHDAMIFKLSNVNGVLAATPENIGVGTIDIAQFVLKRSYIADERFLTCYCADGLFIHKLYTNDPEKKYLFFNDKIRCYHNFCRSPLIFNER